LATRDCATGHAPSRFALTNAAGSEANASHNVADSWPGSTIGSCRRPAALEGDAMDGAPLPAMPAHRGR
jgi:hypothetical protein